MKRKKVYEAVGLVLLAYTVINFAGVFAGSISRTERSYGQNDCDTPHVRWGEIFPGFRIGCYMASPVRE